MKATVTNKELGTINQALSTVSTRDIGSMKFKWNIAKNAVKLKPYVDALNEQMAPDPKFLEHLRKGQKIAKKYCEYTDSGGPMVNEKTQEFVIKPEHKEVFRAEIQKLRAEYKDKIDEHEERGFKTQELLKQTTEIEVHGIRVSDVPEGVLASEMVALDVLWIEDPVEADNVESITKAKTEKKAKDK